MVCDILSEYNRISLLGVDGDKMRIKSKQYKPKITENHIKKDVKQYLSYKGWYHFYLLAGMGAYKGSPDIISIKDGRVLFLEIKKPVGGKQSDHQKKFQEDTEEHGGEYYIIRNLDDLIKIIG